MPGTDAVGLKDGDHACILFGSDEEHRDVIGRFLAEGLLQRERVLNIPFLHTPEYMRQVLREAGTDPDAAEAAGQLSILDAIQTYAPKGDFVPDAMISGLMSNLEKAVDAGWDGMRGSGDMAWALQSRPGTDLLMEYEAKLNDVMPKSRFRAICQYDTRRFDAETLLQVLATHPIAFLGRERFDNFYFMPASEYLSGQREEHQLRRWIHNLRTRHDAEERRQESVVKARMLERAREELASKTAFMNTAAHELATPLTPLGIQVDVLRKSDPDSPLRDRGRNIAILGRGFDRLRTIVDQLLKAARSESPHVRIEKRSTDFRRVLDDAVHAFAQHASDKGVTLRKEPGPPLAVMADAEAIAQVMDNLLANAIKFTPAGGLVALQATLQDGQLAVRVLDTGPGLDEAKLDRLFQPFSQIHDASLEVPGSGLGLFISRNIVERHGGAMWARNREPGPGSEFGFSIPATEPRPSGSRPSRNASTHAQRRAWDREPAPESEAAQTREGKTERN